MHDKTVRRRRAVLGLLTGLALILLTASFGEAGGGVGAIQRGAQVVLSPIQEGASRALKPVRDLLGWFGDTRDAKEQNERLRAQLRDTRRALIANEGAATQNRKLKAMMDFSDNFGLEAYEPVTARVIALSPQVWSSTINVNKGTDDGVEVGDAVIGAAGDGDGGALIGRVSRVTGGSAQIRLVTDQASQVSARVNRTRTPGIVRSAAGGNPNDLVLEFVDSRDEPEEGMRIVTAGTDPRSDLQSLFPPGIPIGEVTRVDDPGSDTQRIHLRPYADLRRLEFVRVLTHEANGNKPLPPGGRASAEQGSR